MRRALGLADHPAASRHGYRGPGASDRFAQRRRFAADGQVPVVISGQQNQGPMARTHPE